MMADAPRPIARESIPGVAAAMEQRHKSFAGFYGFICGLAAVAAVGMAFQPKQNDGPATAIVGGLVWFVPFAFGVRRRLRQARTARAAASADVTWRLQDTQLVAVDANGAPRVELSFPITRKLRATLLAVPQAKVVAS